MSDTTAKPPKPMDICGNCRFVLANNDLSRFLCRRYPPSAAGVWGMHALPAVGEEDWCGEFSPGTPTARPVPM